LNAASVIGVIESPYWDIRTRAVAGSSSQGESDPKWQAWRKAGYTLHVQTKARREREFGVDASLQTPMMITAQKAFPTPHEMVVVTGE
jgi:hypothetical protein